MLRTKKRFIYLCIQGVSLKKLCALSRVEPLLLASQLHTDENLMSDHSLALNVHNLITGRNDFRSVALTSLVMKSFGKKIIKEILFTCIQGNLDPLHFAYRSGGGVEDAVDRGVEDAVDTLLNLVLSHLEGASNF